MAVVVTRGWTKLTRDDCVWLIAQLGQRSHSCLYAIIQFVNKPQFTGPRQKTRCDFVLLTAILDCQIKCSQVWDLWVIVSLLLRQIIWHSVKRKISWNCSNWHHPVVCIALNLAISVAPSSDCANKYWPYRVFISCDAGAVRWIITEQIAFDETQFISSDTNDFQISPICRLPIKHTFQHHVLLRRLTV